MLRVYKIYFLCNIIIYMSSISKISNEIDNIYIFTEKHNYKYYEKITDILHDFSHIESILSDLFLDCKSKKTNTLVIIDDVLGIKKRKLIVIINLLLQKMWRTL